MNNDRRKQLAALLATLREYLELQSTETDRFILQCRRDELRTLLAACN